MRSIIAVLALAFALNAPASTSTTEITDMWWDSTKSGEGFNIILQNNVAFVTFFVYDQNKNPIWYTAALYYQGNFVWVGVLYATTGPWFGGPFDPSLVTRRQAGTATFTLLFMNQATFTYSVDGVVSTLTLTRQTWTNENYSGTYAGGYSIRMSSCTPSSLNGIQEIVGVLNVSQVGASMSVVLTTTGLVCSYVGAYTQTGKLGDVQGTYSCTDGTRGTFETFEMTPTISGLTARVTGRNQFCQWSGYFGGLMRAQ
jgi:hypothetical protein